MNSYSAFNGGNPLWLAAPASIRPNFLAVARFDLSRPRLSAVGATLGIAAGSLTYAVLIMCGLSALIQCSSYSPGGGLACASPCRA